MRFIGLFFILALGLLGSCKSSKVVSFNNPDLRNQSYQTYKIITQASDSLLSDERTIVDELATSINNEMEIRGYIIDNRKSDLMVRYKFFANNRADITTNRTGRRYGSYYDPNFLNFSTRNITESILLIDIHDRKKRKLVWQGSVDLNLSYYKKRKFKEAIPQIVSEIFTTYQLKTTN